MDIIEYEFDQEKYDRYLRDRAFLKQMVEEKLTTDQNIDWTSPSLDEKSFFVDVHGASFLFNGNLSDYFLKRYQQLSTALPWMLIDYLQQNFFIENTPLARHILNKQDFTDNKAFFRQVKRKISADRKNRWGKSTDV